MGSVIDQPDQPDQRPAPLAERLRSAGIGEERARTAITQGRVRVADDIVTDPDTPVPWPTPWIVLPSS